jgi:hypothetical protein
MHEALLAYRGVERRSTGGPDGEGVFSTYPQPDG